MFLARRLAPLVLAAAIVVLAPLAGASVSGDLAYDAGLQWGLDRIGAPRAWEVAQGAGTTIAIVDSGIALDHEDLRDQLVAGIACRDTGGDPTKCQGSAADGDGHGTHVAGIAAAATDNDVGIAGVAPAAALMPVKVLFQACDTCQAAGTAADVAAGIRWATDRGADVINLSLGSTTSAVFGPEFADAIRYAWDRGAIPVVAAGNEFVLTADFGDEPAVVVSAVDRDDAAPSYSRGVGDARWALAAPGGEGGDTASTCAQGGAPLGILSTYVAEDEVGDDDAAYACLAGTSMAAPHVAGALAVLRSAGLTPQQAVDTVLATAQDVGETGRDDVFGAGLLDLAAATAGMTIPSENGTSTTAPTTVAGSPGSDPPPSTTPNDSTPATPPPSTAAPEIETPDLAAPQPFTPESSDDVPVALAVAAGALAAAVGGAGGWLRRARRV